jgi:ABC-type transport system involved in multi-copper enzyme maturation permease subunit
MIARIFIIAKNTFRETMRDRILLSAVVVVIAIILFSLFVGSISLEQDTRMIVDFGLTAIYLLQIFVAVFIGSMLIFKEIERKTFYLLIPKPIERGEIILGKCLGLTGTTLVVTMVSALALFGVLVAKDGTGFILPILFSVMMSTLESVLLILISILFSGLTSPILSAIYTIAFFLIGHSSELLRSMIATADSFFARWALMIVYYLLPNLEKFNIRNEIVYGTVPGVKETLYAVVYAVVYAALLFALARTMFKHKEF